MAIQFYLELLCYYSPLPQLYGVRLALDGQDGNVLQLRNKLGQKAFSS